MMPIPPWKQWLTECSEKCSIGGEETSTKEAVRFMSLSNYDFTFSLSKTAAENGAHFGTLVAAIPMSELCNYGVCVID